MINSADLPAGVTLTPLRAYPDQRGWLAEIFRREWGVTREPCQWNVSVSNPNVLRGVHLHAKHHDYLVVVKGCLSGRLLDVRPKSPTLGRSAMIELSDKSPVAMTIPSGVLHAFYNRDECTLVYGLDRYYGTDQDLVCRWDDPGLGFDWPCTDPVLSDMDRDAGSLDELEHAIRRRSLAFD